MQLAKSRLVLVCALCAALCVALSTGTAAQSSQARRELVRLSEILGSLHHLRGNCLRSEHNEWQQSYQRLLRLQNPGTGLKHEMNQAFNSGYNYYHRNYPSCDPNAAQVARDLAREGERLSKTLMIEY